MIVTIYSECIIRPHMKRVFKGDTVDISKEEYERLCLAGCIIGEPLETKTTAPNETTARQNPVRKGARGR
jgi:hypothetical protein